MADFEQMNTVVSQSSADSPIQDAIFYPLIDADFDCELVPKPALAKSWDWSEDGTILSMELRDDINWADGTKVTAHDVAFTMDLVADPLVASPRINYIKYLKENARPKIIDDTHIEWHFTHAYDRVTQAFHVATLASMPKHILESADRASLRGHEFSTKPLVNGRWKIGKWDRGQRIVLEHNENWSGSKEEIPKLKRVIFRVLPEYATRLVELETGGIDIAQGIQPQDADRLAKEHPEIRLVRRGWRSMEYVGWNSLDPKDYKRAVDELKDGETLDMSTVKPHAMFGDVRVRRALSKAINAEKMMKDLLSSQATGEVYARPAVGTISPALCNAHNDDIVPIAFDPSQAKAELAEAGWTDTDGDGWLDKDGTVFRFALEINSGNPRRAKGSVLVQAMLKQIGIDVQIAQVETNLFFENHRKKNFDAMIGGWSAGLFIDPTAIWHSGPEYEFNFVSYNNPEADALMVKGLKEPDPEKAAVIWKELQAMIYEDQPYTFLYWIDEIIGVHERFQDTSIDVQSPFGDLYKWWVPADEVKYKR